MTIARVNTPQSAEKRPSFCSSIHKKLVAISRSLFNDYVAKPVERYLIGDLRRLWGAPLYGNITEAEKTSGIARRPIGVLGNVILWIPKSSRELGDALNELDRPPHASSSRSIYDPASLLINSSQPMLLGSSNASLRRQMLTLGLLTPEKFSSLMCELWRDGDVNPIRRHIPMKAVAKGILGIELREIECRLLDRMGSDFKKYVGFLFPAWVLKSWPGFKKEQSAYVELVENILQREIQKIKESGEVNGLIPQKIIEKNQQNPNCKNLHKDPEIKSLVLLLLALDNLDIALCQLPSLPGAYERIIEELIDTQTLAKDATLKYSEIMDAERLPSLHRLYQECINPNDKAILGRYVKQGLRCGEHQIPPRTTLLITAPSDDPKAPFSKGLRSCPGRVIAEAIFKTFVVLMLSEISRMNLLHLARGPKYSLMEDYQKARQDFVTCTDKAFYYLVPSNATT